MRNLYHSRQSVISRPRETEKLSGNIFPLSEHQLKKLKKIFFLGLSVFIAFPATSVLADNTGLYAGAGITSTDASEQGIESTKAGLRLTAGYLYNRYLAAEIGLFSTGDHSKLGMKGNGVSLSVLGLYPVYGRLNLFAELGGVMVDLQVDEGNSHWMNMAQQH